MKKQKGFTLVELIIVIIILGILAAYAVPKFINMEKSARTATIQGLAGTISSTAAMIHGIAATTTGIGSNGNGTVYLDAPTNAQPVVVLNGWPDASSTGMGAALSNVSTGGLTATYAGASTPATYVFQSNCNATYTPAPNGGGVATVGYSTSGC